MATSFNNPFKAGYWDRAMNTEPSLWQNALEYNTPGYSTYKKASDEYRWMKDYLGSTGSTPRYGSRFYSNSSIYGAISDTIHYGSSVGGKWWF